MNQTIKITYRDIESGLFILNEEKKNWTLMSREQIGHSVIGVFKNDLNEIRKFQILIYE